MLLPRAGQLMSEYKCLLLQNVKPLVPSSLTHKLEAGCFMVFKVKTVFDQNRQALYDLLIRKPFYGHALPHLRVWMCQLFQPDAPPEGKITHICLRNPGYPVQTSEYRGTADTHMTSKSYAM